MSKLITYTVQAPVNPSLLVLHKTGAGLFIWGSWRCKFQRGVVNCNSKTRQTFFGGRLILLIERLSNLWLYICRQIKLDGTHMSITEFLLNFIILALKYRRRFRWRGRNWTQLKIDREEIFLAVEWKNNKDAYIVKCYNIPLWREGVCYMHCIPRKICFLFCCKMCYTFLKIVCSWTLIRMLKIFLQWGRQRLHPNHAVAWCRSWSLHSNPLRKKYNGAKWIYNGGKYANYEWRFHFYLNYCGQYVAPC